MKNKRRKFTDEFKAKVALDAVKGMKTVSELSSQYQVHASQINLWKRQLTSNATELFSGGTKSSLKSEEELTAPLYEEIGRLKMDVKWLEKKL